MAVSVISIFPSGVMGWSLVYACGIPWSYASVFGRFYLVLLNEINKTESDTFNIKCG